MLSKPIDAVDGSVVIIAFVVVLQLLLLRFGLLEYADTAAVHARRRIVPSDRERAHERPGREHQ